MNLLLLLPYLPYTGCVLMLTNRQNIRMALAVLELVKRLRLQGMRCAHTNTRLTTLLHPQIQDLPHPKLWTLPTLNINIDRQLFCCLLLPVVAVAVFSSLLF